MAACLLKRFGSNETRNFPKAELLCQVLNLHKQDLLGAAGTLVTIGGAQEDGGTTKRGNNALLQLY